MSLGVAEQTFGGATPVQTARFDQVFQRGIAEGDSFFANWADFPSVLALDDRRLVAHWLWKVSGDTYGYHVRTARSVDGGRTWSAQATLHTDTSATEHGFVSWVPEGAGLRDPEGSQRVTKKDLYSPSLRAKRSNPVWRKPLWIASLRSQ